MIVELSKYKVTIKEELTWGDMQKIKGAMFKNVKTRAGANAAENMEINIGEGMIEAQYVTMETYIEKAETKEGTPIAVTREWINGLSVSDGDKLYNAIDTHSKKNNPTLSATPKGA